jgi:hypothetical protein
MKAFIRLDGQGFFNVDHIESFYIIKNQGIHDKSSEYILGFYIQDSYFIWSYFETEDEAYEMLNDYIRKILHCNISYLKNGLGIPNMDLNFSMQKESNMIEISYNWKKISEVLPTANVDVLIKIKDDNLLHIGHLFLNREQCSIEYKHGEDISITETTHWIELPNLPKEI